MIDFSQIKALILCSAFNSMTQKIWATFAHKFGDCCLMTELAPKQINNFAPDLIICPFLLTHIPSCIWRNYPCFIVHPGPPEDAGRSSLNWAILAGKTTWAVCIRQADAGWDTGPLWATQQFHLPYAALTTIYRNNVADIVVHLLPEAISRYMTNQDPLPEPTIILRPPITREYLAFSWQETTAAILRKIHAGDSAPGASSALNNKLYYFYASQAADKTGKAGEIIHLCSESVTIGTIDGSIRIARMSTENNIKVRPSLLLNL